MSEEQTTGTTITSDGGNASEAQEQAGLLDNPFESEGGSASGEGVAPADESPSDEGNAAAASQAEIKAEDISIPEGMEYDEEIGKGFLEVVNECKLSKEQTQKLFDLYQGQVSKFFEGVKAAEAARAKRFTEELAQEKAEWVKQCEGDSEFGGQKWEASQAVINRGCEHLATSEAVKLMQAYNLNTNPEIVRMFYRAGLLVTEDSSAVAGNGNGKDIDPAMAIFGASLKEYHKRREGNN